MASSRGTLRVIGGSFKGRRLRVPRGAVRPTSDRVREALFDILGEAIVGSVFLDGYAGTGAVGIEALSRGAREVTLVENDEGTLRTLRGNLAVDPGIESRARVIPSDLALALRRLRREGVLFDTVFIDPPYGAELDRGLRLVGSSGVLAEGALVIAEHETRHPPAPPRGLLPVRTRDYGRAALSLFRSASREGGDGRREAAGGGQGGDPHGGPGGPPAR
jgi:16S rRNA (guanine(966)-N(2))-methyltransferase RsmD